MNDIITVVELGSHKSMVLIGEVLPDDSLQVIGIGESSVTGVQRGNIVNIEKAERGLQEALANAEEMANLRVKNAIVCIGGDHLTSAMSHGAFAISNRDKGVTKKDIDKRLKAEFGYFPEGSPTPRPTFETLPTSTLSPAQLAIISPTPEITQVITSTPEITQVITETAESTATLMPTENNPGPTSTALPTATPYTEKAYQDNLKTALQNLESQIGIGEEFLRDYFEVELYRQQLRDIITEDVTSEEEQVWVRHILVSDETTAQEVLDRLENGEDFKELAKEFSIDTATAVRGGDLGWFGKGRMDKAFEKAAFSLDIGEISKPVQSSFGWHIIEALGHEMRPLTEYQYEQKRNQVFNDWIASVRETTDVVINEDWGSYVPVEPVIPDKLLLP